jgi:N-acyl-D-amino-acid deacylase
MLKRFDDPSAMTRIRAEMTENLRRRGGPASILMTASGVPWTGKTLDAMAHDWKVDPIDAAIRMLRGGTVDGRVPRHGEGTAMASFNMIESDVEAIMRQPWVVTSSDGSDGHPRQCATFPEKYAVYVRTRHVITLQNFIRHSSGLTADLFHLDWRGYLRNGYFADVVVLDPQHYAPRADYLHPRELSTGVEALFVNGQLAVEHGKVTGAAAGCGLLRPTPAAGCPRP